MIHPLGNYRQHYVPSQLLVSQRMVQHLQNLEHVLALLSLLVWHDDRITSITCYSFNVALSVFPILVKNVLANSCLVLKTLVHPPLCSIPHINAGAFGGGLVLIPSLVSCTVPCIIFLINCDPNTLLLFDHFVIFNQLPLSFLILKRRLPFDTSNGL